jgi:hypothetical protein
VNDLIEGQFVKVMAEIPFIGKIAIFMRYCGNFQGQAVVEDAMGHRQLVDPACVHDLEWQAA